MNKYIENIANLPNFVGWGKVGADNPKVPFQATGYAAKPTDPSTWATLDKIMPLVDAGTFRGVGFCFTDEAGKTGLDIDHCLMADGTPDPDTKAGQAAIYCLDQLGNSYHCEYSMSRTGLHWIIDGTIDKNINAAADTGIEMYSRKRYFALTLNDYDHVPDHPADPNALQNIYGKYRPIETAPTEQPKRANLLTPSFNGGEYTREQARAKIRATVRCEDYLEPSRNGLYCCPFCGSGHNGNKNTGALKLHKDTNTWYCNKCEKWGDVIDLHKQYKHCDYNEALQELADSLDITIRKYTPTERAIIDFAGEFDDEDEPTPAEIGNGENGAESRDIQAYYDECVENLQTYPAAVEWLQDHGISESTAQAYKVGFDPVAAVDGNGDVMPSLIIPNSNGNYSACAIDDNVPYLYNGDGVPGIFNLNAIYSDPIVFVTQNVLDALSLLEIGAPAVALNSEQNITALIEQLDRVTPTSLLVVAMHSDENGRRYADDIRAAVKGISDARVIGANICGEYDSPHDAIMGDREAFIAQVFHVMDRTDHPDSAADYLEAEFTADVNHFKTEMFTGFANLDKITGGIYSGLYCIAAQSSIGKTTFAVQLADQIVERGGHVIYFSLEQSRFELTAKTLTRYADAHGITKPNGKAMDNLAVRKGALGENTGALIAEYRAKHGNRLNIHEANFNCTVDFIGRYVEQYMQRNDGCRPLVIVDYLQILQPSKQIKASTMKEQVDYNVTALKRMSRRLDIPVLAISSVNRSSYLSPTSFEALKESGSIEFSVDVAWALDLACMTDDPIFDEKEKIKKKRATIEAAKNREPCRQIKLHCLKNRFGIPNFYCDFDYYASSDTFVENGGKKLYSNGTTADVDSEKVAHKKRIEKAKKVFADEPEVTEAKKKRTRKPAKVVTKDDDGVVRLDITGAILSGMSQAELDDQYDRVVYDDPDVIGYDPDDSE